MRPVIAISIINYKTEELTIAAVRSVLDDLGSRPAKVVIVDNASGDGSAEVIQRWLDTLNDDRVTLCLSPTNSGFSGGHNQGLTAAQGADYFLILNSDALIRPGFFNALDNAIAKHPDAGLIAPQLEWEDGTPQVSCFRFASPASELIRGAETGPVSRLLNRYDIALPTPPDPLLIEWASFACILVKGDMVRQIGLMDQGYFLYFEDAEYALRANNAGWKTVYDPAARVVHFRGGSGPVKSLQVAKKRLPDYYWRARSRFLRQAHGPFGPVMSNICWMLGRLIAQMRRLSGRVVPPAHENEWSDIWTGIFSPLKPDPRSPK